MIDKTRSDRILKEIDRRINGDRTVKIEEEDAKLVLFLLCGDYYAFYGKNIKEILPQKKIFYVPGAPDFITGVVNVRGDIESVININKFLGLPDPTVTQKSRILIAVNGDMRSGILVDSVEDVIDVPLSSIKQPLSTLEDSKKDFVAGELFYKNRNVTVLNLERVFERVKA